MIVNPLHIADVAGERLRFFKSPLADGRPDLPWHSVDDLHCCLKLPPDLRLTLQRNAGRWTVKSVATAVGIDQIAPHYVAEAMISGAISIGLASANVEHAYMAASNQATRLLMASSGLTFATDGWFNWMTRAMQRWRDVGVS
jgi:hypothetical protein